MKRVITINGREGRYDCPSFILAENQSLTISVNAPQARSGSYYLTYTQGERKRTICLKGVHSVVLPAQWLLEGDDSPLLGVLELRDTMGVAVYNRYFIEPLEVVRTKVGIECFASVQKVEAENAELRGIITEMDKRFASLELRVYEYEKNGVEIQPEDEE